MGSIGMRAAGWEYSVSNVAGINIAAAWNPSAQLHVHCPDSAAPWRTSGGNIP